MKLTLKQLEQLGLTHEPQLVLATELLTRQLQKDFYSETKKNEYRKALEELKQYRENIREAANHHDQEIEIISIEEFKVLCSILKPIVADKADGLSNLTSLYYIDSAQRYGYSFQESYEQHANGFRQQTPVLCLLAKVNAIMNLSDDGANLETTTKQLQEKLEKIQNECFEKALQADLSHNKQGNHDAYRKAQKLNWYGYQRIDNFDNKSNYESGFSVFDRPKVYQDKDLFEKDSTYSPPSNTRRCSKG